MPVEISNMYMLFEMLIYKRIILHVMKIRSSLIPAAGDLCYIQYRAHQTKRVVFQEVEKWVLLNEWAYDGATQRLWRVDLNITPQTRNIVPSKISRKTFQLTKPAFLDSLPTKNGLAQGILFVNSRLNNAKNCK